jgi:hypothetical protein
MMDIEPSYRIAFLTLANAPRGLPSFPIASSLVILCPSLPRAFHSLFPSSQLEPSRSALTWANKLAGFAPSSFSSPIIETEGRTLPTGIAPPPAREFWGVGAAASFEEVGMFMVMRERMGMGEVVEREGKDASERLLGAIRKLSRRDGSRDSFQVECLLEMMVWCEEKLKVHALRDGG